MIAGAWGLWLAASWTWCIALLLPTVLMADAGPGAWAVMFVCNVAGVAAMPFVFPTPAASMDFVRRHRMACRVFSWVTLLCQGWVAGWALAWLPWPAAIAAIGAVAGLAVAGRARPVWLAAAALCWAGTVAAGLVDLHAGPAGRLTALLRAELGWHPLALLALPLLFTGFIASPWLDLTIHQALRACPQPRRAFAIMFPVLFGSMLLVSLVWRDDIAAVLLHGTSAASWVMPALAAIVCQLGFTAVLHARHLPRPRMAMAAAALAAGLAWMTGQVALPIGHTVNELLYRSSLGFYAVVVPCWLWARSVRASTILLAAAALCVAAVPLLIDPAYRILDVVAFLLIAAVRLVPPLPARVASVQR